MDIADNCENKTFNNSTSDEFETRTVSTFEDVEVTDNEAFDDDDAVPECDEDDVFGNLYGVDEEAEARKKQFQARKRTRIIRKKVHVQRRFKKHLQHEKITSDQQLTTAEFGNKAGQETKTNAESHNEEAAVEEEKAVSAAAVSAAEDENVAVSQHHKQNTTKQAIKQTNKTKKTTTKKR
eukprot:GDKK01068801.1.p1 GENE.GDKK01068801.1~~GDKK01068801.1.p1  ORF type:complete len:206 (-),score=64.96 GDKK01068801.1:17-556(-)